MQYDSDIIFGGALPALPEFVTERMIGGLIQHTVVLRHQLACSWDSYKRPTTDFGVEEEPPVMKLSPTLGKSGYCRRLADGRHEVTVPVGLYIRTIVLSHLAFHHGMYGKECWAGNTESKLDLSPIFCAKTTNRELEDLWNSVIPDEKYYDLTIRYGEIAYCLSLLHEVGHVVMGHQPVFWEEYDASAVVGSAREHRYKALQHRLQDWQGLEVAEPEVLLERSVANLHEVGAREDAEYAVSFLEDNIGRGLAEPIDWNENALKQSLELLADGWAMGAFLQANIFDSQPEKLRQSIYGMTASAYRMLQCILSDELDGAIETSQSGYPPSSVRFDEALSNSVLVLWKYKKDTRFEKKGGEDALKLQQSCLLDLLAESENYPRVIVESLENANRIDDEYLHQSRVQELEQIKDEVNYAVGLCNAWGEN